METPGIGQGDTDIVDYVDKTVYVMTPEYGSASQLEKIDMLDYADFVAVNKYDAKGAEDAHRDVCKQVQRNKEAFHQDPKEMPVYGTISSRFNDDGVTALFQAIAEALDLPIGKNWRPEPLESKVSTNCTAAIPPSRIGYLSEIASVVRNYRQSVQRQSVLAREIQQLRASAAILRHSGSADLSSFDQAVESRRAKLTMEAHDLLRHWPGKVDAMRGSDDNPIDRRSSSLFRRSISGTYVPKISLPRFHDHGDLLTWLMLENLPGSFPYTGGAFAFKREDEDPTRMFAGEGGPAKTNRRFKLLSKESSAKRLSTAFDSVSLYGFDPDERPDIYGKVGNSEYPLLLWTI